MKKQVTRLLAMLALILLWGVLPVEAEAKLKLQPPEDLSVYANGEYTDISFEVPDSHYYYDVVYRVQCCEYGNWEELIYDYTTYGTQDSFYYLTQGTEYHFRVRAEVYWYNGEYVEPPYVSEWSNRCSIVVGEEPPALSKMKLTAKPGGITSVKLSWKRAEKCAEGYIIYRAETEDGYYEEIATISDADTTTYRDKNLTFGKYYYYMIQSYGVVDGEMEFSEESKPVKTRAMITSPVVKSVKVAGVSTAKLTWSKTSYASGYRIYRATSYDGPYVRLKEIKGNKTFSYTAKNLKNGMTYYFKIRAFREVNGKRYYSEYSEIKNRLMDKLGYQYESYESRAQRIFGKNYYKEYKTSKTAKKNMKTIKVKTWDINKKGKKYTRTHSVTVHKNIAPTVKQIFKEIYQGKEKFPIKYIGGYAWRGSSSSSEHCEGLAIDINPDENAQINGSTGKAMVGRFYKPGKNKYSIKPNGDVVRVFQKYGFYWGNWFYNPDYMHFSYFGT